MTTRVLSANLRSSVSSVGDAQSTAWHKTGDITSHYCAGELAEFPKAERDPEDACIDVAALGGAAADEGGEWREKSRKSRAGKKRVRSATPNPLIIGARQDLNP